MLEFTVQAIFTGNLRLPILDRLSRHGLRDQAAELTRTGLRKSY
jgi:hypothetical protein